MGDYKEKVGKPTGEMSTVGRPIYKTPEGKIVSEQSTTFKYKGKWINIPTIHNGYSYNDDELRLMLDHDLLKPTSTHKNIKAAEKAAETRSSTLRNFAEGGSVEDQTEMAFAAPKSASDLYKESKVGKLESKGMGYGELIVDNILGLDNEYETFGEKIGKTINEDEVKFLKSAALGAWEGAIEVITHPEDWWSTITETVESVADSVKRLGNENLNTRLLKEYNVDYTKATPKQINAVKESIMADALVAIELVPAAAGVTKGLKAVGKAIPSGVKADVVGQTKALLGGDTEFLKGTPTELSSTVGVGAERTSRGIGDNNPPESIESDPESPPESIESDPESPFETVVSDNYEEIAAEPIGPDPYGRFGMDANSPPPNKGAITKKKSEVNPLFKTKEELPFPGGSTPVDINKNPFYSSIKPAMENLNVGKDGVKGSSVIKYLKKNAPNINMTELYWSGMLENAPMRDVMDFRDSSKPQYGIDPDKVYTKDELVYMADVSVPKVTVKKLSSKDIDFPPAWGDTQRVEIRTNVLQPGNVVTGSPPQTRVVTFMGEDNRIDSEYVELILLNENSRGHKYRSADAHWQGKWTGYNKDHQVLTHVRGSYVPVLKEMGGPNNLLNNMASFGRKPKPIKVFVIEELQSDPVQKETIASAKTSKDVASKAPKANSDYHVYEDELATHITDYVNSFGGNLALTPKFNRMFNVDSNSPIADRRIKEKEGFKELARVLKNAKYKLDGGTLRDRFDVAQQISDELQLLGGNLAVSRILRRTVDSDNPEEYMQEIQMNVIGDIIFSKKIVNDQDLRSTMYSDIVFPLIDTDIQPTDITPAGLSDTIRASLLAVIRDAKQNQTSTIVVPPLEDIMRVHSLEEGPAKQTYQDALTKVLKSLESETNGKISFKTGKVEGLEFASKKNYKIINFNPSIVDDTKQARFAEGGSVSAMNNQTEMMLEEGGIADDGMNRDPVSGNEIPPGSMAKEVRDDVPANLSEGEYVVPADVVRFFGVKFFEDLRVQAKQGLMKMEKNGRIGGEPTSSAPPSGGGEISEEELMLILKEELGKEAPQGQPSPQPRPQPKPIGMMNKGGYASTSMASYRKNFNAGGVVNAAEGVDVAPKFRPLSNAYGGANVGTGRGMTSVPYENASGDVMYFTFINDRLYPRGIKIPTGFNPMAGYENLAPASQQVTPVASTETEETCAAKGMIYDPTTKQCKVVEKDSDPIPETEADSTAWMDKFELKKGTTSEIIQNALNVLKKGDSIGFASEGLSIFNPIAGVLGFGKNASTYAQVAGVVIALQESMTPDEKGGKHILDADDLSEFNTLKEQLAEFKANHKLTKLPLEWINGDKFAKQINATHDDFALHRNSKDLDGNKIFSSDDDWNKQLNLTARPGYEWDGDKGEYVHIKGYDKNKGLGTYVHAGTEDGEDYGYTSFSRPGEATFVEAQAAGVAGAALRPKLATFRTYPKDEDNTDTPITSSKDISSDDGMKGDKPSNDSWADDNVGSGHWETEKNPNSNTWGRRYVANKGGLITKRKKKKKK